jgi:hypothetical protein
MAIRGTPCAAGSIRSAATPPSCSAPRTCSPGSTSNTARSARGSPAGRGRSRSPAGAEQTVIAFCPGEKALKIDVRRASLDPDAIPLAFPAADKSVRVQSAPLDLAPGEPLRLRLFLDRSILEVYANGRQCVTQRIYPSRADSLQIRLFSRGGPTSARRIEAWPMAPAHD